MITQGDSTSAFGNKFLEVNLVVPSGQTVSKAVFVCGAVSIEYQNPVFPLLINLTSEQTSELKCGKNTGYLVVYDSNGQKRTCEGSVEFIVNPRKA